MPSVLHAEPVPGVGCAAWRWARWGLQAEPVDPDCASCDLLAGRAGAGGRTVALSMDCDIVRSVFCMCPLDPDQETSSVCLTVYFYPKCVSSVYFLKTNSVNVGTISK